MKALHLHPWNLSPQQARKLQEDLGPRVERQDRWEGIRFVAGADIALDAKAGVGFAGVVVYRFPELVEVERQHASASLTFPYIPGLLAFREIPVLLGALQKVKMEPDLIFCDGHGISHPRRFGIACHLGLVLDRPTVGVAKSRLVGHYEEPAAASGAWSPLMDGDERIGTVLRTRPGTNPVFVSQGHRISLESALEITLATYDGYRIPKPTREADAFVARLKAGRYKEPQARQGTLRL